MVDLPTIPLNVVTSEPGKSSVSASDVSGTYSDMARAFDKLGEGLNDVAKPMAEQQGLKAVTRDSEGNIQVAQAPFFGDAAIAYHRAVKIAALAEGEGEAKRKDLELRTEFRDNPQGYQAAANKYRQEVQADYTSKAGPAVGLAMGRAIDAVTTQTYRGLLNEKERLDLQRADKSIEAGIASARDDLVALARGGDTSSAAFQAGVDKIKTLTQERVNNPRLAYPPEAAKYDLQQLDGDLRANGFLHHIDQLYKDDGVNPDGSQRGGAKTALEASKQILTDPSVKLTEPQRQQYYNKAVAEIRANEALRRQDISEARAAENALRMVSATGGKVQPEEVEHIAAAYRAANSPGDVARVYAHAARMKLNDDFGLQPLTEQTNQLTELRGMPRQKQAYDFFLNKGYTPVQAAGIVGGLRGETADLNTAQVHDGGIGLGIAGWNGPRLQALKQFAAANKMNPFELNTQLEFVHSELQGSEGAAGAKLRAAQTPEQAGQAMLGYFRPKNFDVPGAHPERSIYSRAAFNAFSGQAPDGTGVIPVGANATPAASLWLQANRASAVQKAARGSWDAVMKDYNTSGIRPANNTINGIIDAAHATNDHALLEGIWADTQRMDKAEGLSHLTLPEQHAVITEGQASGAAGEVSSVGQGAVLRDLERKNAAITNGLKDNPISTTIANYPNKFGTPAPLDLKDPQNFAAGIAYRGKIAQFAQQAWQPGPVHALDEPDIKQIQGALDSPDPTIKASIFKGLSILPDDVRNATLKKIGEARPDMAVAAAAGGMMQTAPDIAESIFRGQSAIKADKGFEPAKGVEETAYTQKLDTLLPASTFTLAARTDATGPYAAARGMIKARYADLSAQAGDTTGKLNDKRLTQATTDVTGGILYHNGGPFIAPARGMPQNDFDRLMSEVSDKDLAGVTTKNGQPVDAAYLRSSAQLESAGQGRYYVKLGKDPMNPIYAMTGANTETPRPFILDLRNRTVPPVTADWAGAAAMTAQGN